MRLLAVMVVKDLRRQLRSPLGMSLVLAFPLVFAGLLAFVFGGGADDFPKVELLIEDRDDTFLSGMMLSAAGSEQMAQYFDVTQVAKDEGQQRMERGEASALLRIPEGFSKKLLEGDPVTLELVRNPAQGIMPEVAEQALTVFAELLSSASRVAREPLDDLSAMLDDEGGPSEIQVAAMSVDVYRLIESTGDLAIPPVITLEAVQLEAEPSEESGSTFAMIFLAVLPGISVWALFLVGDMAMRDLLAEGTAGTLRRQLIGPIRPTALVLGKALYTATLATISLVLLASIGWFASDGGVNLLGFLVLSAALILGVTGFSSAIYGLARTERQGGTFASVIFLASAFLGGSFIQVDSLPTGIRRFSPFSPFYWGTTGYQELLRDGGGVLDILPQAGVLAGMGALLLLVGGTLLGRKTNVRAAA